MNRSLPYVVRQAQLMARNSPELKAFIKDALKTISSLTTKDEKIAWVRSRVDQHIAEDSASSQCQKGCHHCCYHPISLSTLEMNNIIQDNPFFDVSRLLAQKNHFDRDAPISYKNRACIFLDSNEGVCTIYEARPLICRLTHVSSLPENCHWENEEKQIEHLPVTKAALLVGAFYMIHPDIDLIAKLMD